MKTNEFISKMNELAFAEIDESGTVINIDIPTGETVGWVSINDFGVVKLIFEYALTPLSERKDELKFRVRFLPGKFNRVNSLNG